MPIKSVLAAPTVEWFCQSYWWLRCCEFKPRKNLPLGIAKWIVWQPSGCQCRCTLADLVDSLAAAHRAGQITSKLRFYTRAALLIVDETGFLPLPKDGANLFFQLVSARNEKGAMILTSNRSFTEWAEVFGDPVVATALLDRLLHYAIVVQIEGASYRLRAHSDPVFC